MLYGNIIIITVTQVAERFWWWFVSFGFSCSHKHIRLPCTFLSFWHQRYFYVTRFHRTVYHTKSMFLLLISEYAVLIFEALCSWTIKLSTRRSWPFLVSGSVPPYLRYRKQREMCNESLCRLSISIPFLHHLSSLLNHIFSQFILLFNDTSNEHRFQKRNWSHTWKKFLIYKVGKKIKTPNPP